MATKAIVWANASQTESLHPVFAKVYQLTVIERTLHALDRVGVSDVTIIGGQNTAQLKKILSKKKPENLALSWNDEPETAYFDKDFFLFKIPLVISTGALDILRNQGSDSFSDESRSVFYFGDQTNISSPQELKAALQAAKNISLPNQICTAVHTKQQLSSTKKQLIKSLTKPTDGWVSRNLNRPISTQVSRILAHTSVTPNQFTIFTGVIALVTGYFMAVGGYWNWVIGAGLFHLTSVMDGVDGELARLKFKSSPFGQWLDTVVDNLSYVVGLGALVVGVFNQGITPAVKWAGILAVLFSLLALGSLYLYLVRFGKGGTLLNVEYGFQNKSGWYPKMMSILSAFGKRDLFALIFFVLALFGQLPMALGYVAIMAAAVFGFSIQAHLIASKNARTS